MIGNISREEHVVDDDSSAMDIDDDVDGDVDDFSGVLQKVRLVVVPSDHAFQQTRRCLSLVGPGVAKVVPPAMTQEKFDRLEQGALALWNTLMGLTQGRAGVCMHVFNRLRGYVALM